MYAKKTIILFIIALLLLSTGCVKPFSHPVCDFKDDNISNYPDNLESYIKYRRAEYIEMEECGGDVWAPIVPRIILETNKYTIVKECYFCCDRYTLILDDESQLELSKDTCVDSVVIEKIDLKGKSVEQHVFNRINGEWMLTRINRNTMFQNPNKSFLAFYERFATDSLFQEESINDPVATILPDPDDDFTMVEGEFHPDQWEDFKPPVLPSEFIYNVIYGQEYRLSKQKLFVVRGMSNGLETEMTFKKVDG